MRITVEGLELEADQRHSEVVVKQLGLEGANIVSTPADDEVENKDKDDGGRNMSDTCDVGYATLYKYIAARLNDLSPDRPDLQYFIKEVCRRMSDPC